MTQLTIVKIILLAVKTILMFMQILYIYVIILFEFRAVRNVSHLSLCLDTLVRSQQI